MFLVRQTLNVDGCSIDPSKLLIFLDRKKKLIESSDPTKLYNKKKFD